MSLSFKEIMTEAMHRLYRSDEWLQELFRVTGLSLSEAEQAADDIHANNFFDTATAAAVERYERDLGIIPTGTDLDDRRAVIRAKWLGTGKVDLLLLQQVADSWRDGSIDLEFTGGKIHVTFISPIGVPRGLAELQAALGNIKPAHLAMYYTFLYLTWGETKIRTWNDLKTGTWMDVKRLPT